MCSLPCRSPPGAPTSSTGLVQYEDMLALLTCLQCGELVSPPVVQCRKGHLYCSSCKASHHLLSCRICKQTFVDAPNQALEKMVTFIGLPCKYGQRGCTEVVFLPSRLQHESLCKFRPMECQFQVHGCQAVFAYKVCQLDQPSYSLVFQDLCWHHKMCEFAHFPHPNVLPAMPDRKKSAKQTKAVEPLSTPTIVTTSPTAPNLCAEASDNVPNKDFPLPGAEIVASVS